MAREMDPDVVNSPAYRDTIRNDLKSIPTMSLVLNPSDLFGTRTGIYTNSTASGPAFRVRTLEGMLRYYPYVGQNAELWIGLTGGLVVLNDRFQIVDDYDKPLIGPAGVTIRTEGGTLGLAFGGLHLTFGYIIARRYGG